MMLVLDAIDPDGTIRRFATDLPTLEVSFDFLSSLVRKGTVLLKVYVKDGPQRVNLPVEAFDGMPFAVHMHTLQEDWQAILTEATYKDLLHEDRVWLANHWVEQCNFRIKHHKHMLSWAGDMGQQKSFKAKAELAYYNEQLTYHQNQLAQAECRLSVMKNWLNQLTATSN